MFWINRKKYDNLKNKNDDLKLSYEKALKTNKKLQQKIDKLKQIEYDERKSISENLVTLEKNKTLTEEIQDLQIYDKFKYFESNYKFKNYSTDLKYIQFNSIFDSKKWAENIFKDYISKIKQIRNGVYIFKPFIFDTSEALNGKITGIEYYCGYSYREMNILLRKIYKNEFDFRLLSYYKNLCNLLIFEFLYAPLIPDNIVVFRYVSEENFFNILESFVYEDQYIELGFLSTTLIKNIQKDTQEHYSCYNYVLKIHVPKNSRAVFTSLIAGREFEQELLFPNNSILKPIGNIYYDKEYEKICIDLTYENYIDSINLFLDLDSRN